MQPHCVGTVLGKVGAEFSVSHFYKVVALETGTKFFKGSVHIGVCLAAQVF